MRIPRSAKRHLVSIRIHHITDAHAFTQGILEAISSRQQEVHRVPGQPGIGVHQDSALGHGQHTIIDLDLATATGLPRHTAAGRAWHRRKYDVDRWRLSKAALGVVGCIKAIKAAIGQCHCDAASAHWDDARVQLLRHHLPAQSKDLVLLNRDVLRAGAPAITKVPRLRAFAGVV